MEKCACVVTVVHQDAEPRHLSLIGLRTDKTSRKKMAMKTLRSVFSGGLLFLYFFLQSRNLKWNATEHSALWPRQATLRICLHMYSSLSLFTSFFLTSLLFYFLLYLISLCFPPICLWSRCRFRQFLSFSFSSYTPSIRPQGLLQLLPSLPGSLHGFVLPEVSLRYSIPLNPNLFWHTPEFYSIGCSN
jgi:hypothetical protein